MRVVACREFVYNREFKERGQVFELGGFANDSLLLKWGHIREFKGSKASLYRCDGCCRDFATEKDKQDHDVGRVHKRSPNYEGPQAAKTGRPPKYIDKELVAQSSAMPVGKAPR